MLGPNLRFQDFLEDISLCFFNSSNPYLEQLGGFDFLELSFEKQHFLQLREFFQTSEHVEASRWASSGCRREARADDGKKTGPDTSTSIT